MEVLDRLIDEKVKGFKSWKSAMIAEDIRQEGEPIRRTQKAWDDLYRMYLHYQEAPGVVKRRQYLYGKNA